MKKMFFIGAVFLSLLILVSCSGGDGSASSKRTGAGEPRSYDLRMPEPGTTQVTESKGAKIDTSNAHLGYTIVTCSTGKDKRLKVQIKSAEKKYDFDVNNQGRPEIFPFTLGNGTYSVTVMENVTDNRYTPIATADVNVALESEYAPYLVPNQFVNYNANSSTVAFGYDLTKDCGTDLEVVDAIYEYIIKNIEYDYEKAATVKPGYLPNVDDTLATKKGICFDYSALAAALLRSHDIPTKLVTGKADPSIENHAWNLIYIKEEGWIKRTIHFDGKNWTLVDTTLDAGGNTEKITYIPNYEY